MRITDRKHLRRSTYDGERTHLFNSGYIEEQQLLCDEVSYILLPRTTAKIMTAISK